MKKNSSALIVFLVCCLIIQTAFGQDNSGLAALEAYLTPPAGWEAESRPEAVLSDEKLFEQINGGAMQYVKLGFSRGLFVTFKSKQQFVNVELFEMKNDEAAHKIYLIKAGSASSLSNIGNEASLAEYYLMFRKGRFFVSLSGSQSGKKAEETLVFLAKTIAKKI